MKKLFVFIILGLILAPGMNCIFAQTCAEYCAGDIPDPPADQVCICNPLTTERFEDIINNIIDFLFKIIVVLAPLMIVIGGFMFFTSGGDPKKVSQARNLMIWAAVGFAVILLAKGFMALLKSILGIT